jgi:hypothetical protein
MCAICRASYPIPMQTAEPATSLVEEAFAFISGVIIDEGIARPLHAKKKRGLDFMPSRGFSPEALLRYYMLEKGFAVTKKQLASPEAQLGYKQMTSDVDALAIALRAHLDG